jgi:hypothetical protein
VDLDDLGALLADDEQITQYAGAVLDGLGAAGMLPSGVSLASLSALQVLPFAVWGWMVKNGISIALNPTTVDEHVTGWWQPEFTRHNPYSDETVDVGQGPGRWATMGLRPDLTEQVTGYRVWCPLFRTVTTMHTGGRFWHWLALEDSLVYDTSGRLRSVGDELPAGQYRVVDPVLWIDEQLGWCLGRATGIGYILTTGDGDIPKLVERMPGSIPGDWKQAIHERMADVVKLRQAGWEVSSSGPVPGLPGGGRRPGSGPGRPSGLGAGAVALTLLSVLFSGGDA